MQAADTPGVERQIRRALANGQMRILEITGSRNDPLTVNDARHVIACLENPRFDTLRIFNYSLHDDAVLNVFRDGILLCTAVKTVRLKEVQLGNEDLDRLRPAFYNTSVTTLNIYYNEIQGRRGGEVLRDLLVGNDTMLDLNLSYIRRFGLGPEVAIGLGQGLARNIRLQTLNLSECHIGNEGLENLLLPIGEANNNSLTELNLRQNNIQGADGGRQVSLLLQSFPALKVLKLNSNRNLGPLGARALALGLAAASHLEKLCLQNCNLGIEGVASLVPDGQVDTSLTQLALERNDIIPGTVGGENVVALASRCTNLDSIHVYHSLGPDQKRRMNLLLDRKRLCTRASALGGSTFSVLFRAVEEAHGHEQGLSAIFLILQNDGCNANNRAIE